MPSATDGAPFMSVFFPQALPFILAIDLYDLSWLKLVPNFFYFSVAWTSWPKDSFGAKSWGRFLTRRRRSSWRHTPWKSARSSARGWSSWPGASSAASGRQLTSSKSKMRGSEWKVFPGRGTNLGSFNFCLFREAEHHTGSLRDSHPPSPGSNPGSSRYFLGSALPSFFPRFFGPALFVDSWDRTHLMLTQKGFHKNSSVKAWAKYYKKFVYFPSHIQCLWPVGYCPPPPAKMLPFPSPSKDFSSFSRYEPKPRKPKPKPHKPKALHAWALLQENSHKKILCLSLLEAWDLKCLCSWITEPSNAWAPISLSPQTLQLWTTWATTSIRFKFPWLTN